jgi:hypothetical protein
MSSDNFAVVGQNVTGSNAGRKGTLPADVKALPPSTTPMLLILGRTLVDGKADVPAAQKLMHQYRLTPLSMWGKADAEVPEDRNVFKPYDAKTDPLADFKTMNQNMAENPPEPRHAVLMKQFAELGVGPGLNVDQLDESTKRGLARAAVEGRRILAASVDNPKYKTVNGWKYPPPYMGRAGAIDDFLTRGGKQCMWGIISQDPPQATYLSTSSDSDGQPLSGGKQYTMHFQPGGLPEVKAFWSLTLYDETNDFVDNPLNRYSLGDRSAQMEKDADGGLTIYIQSDSPGADKEGNWLPAEKGKPFSLTLRTYVPGKAIVDQTWPPPAVVPAKKTASLEFRVGCRAGGGTRETLSRYLSMSLHGCRSIGLQVCFADLSNRRQAAWMLALQSTRHWPNAAYLAMLRPVVPSKRVAGAGPEPASFTHSIFNRARNEHRGRAP